MFDPMLDPSQWRVLIIDDDTTALRFTSFILRRYNATVLTATDGAEGLAIMRAQRPTVVLLDIWLRRPSSLDVIAAIRADPELRDLPVIAWTEQVSVQERLFASGFDGCLIKLHHPSNVVSTIQAVLGANRSKGAVRN